MSTGKTDEERAVTSPAEAEILAMVPETGEVQITTRHNPDALRDLVSRGVLALRVGQLSCAAILPAATVSCIDR